MIRMRVVIIGLVAAPALLSIVCGSLTAVAADLPIISLSCVHDPGDEILDLICQRVERVREGRRRRCRVGCAEPPQRVLEEGVGPEVVGGGCPGRGACATDDGLGRGARSGTCRTVGRRAAPGGATVGASRRPAGGAADATAGVT